MRQRRPRFVGRDFVAQPCWDYAEGWFLRVLRSVVGSCELLGVVFVFEVGLLKVLVDDTSLATQQYGAPSLFEEEVHHDQQTADAYDLVVVHPAVTRTANDEART